MLLGASVSPMEVTVQYSNSHGIFPCGLPQIICSILVLLPIPLNFPGRVSPFLSVFGEWKCLLCEESYSQEPETTQQVPYVFWEFFHLMGWSGFFCPSFVPSAFLNVLVFYLGCYSFAPSRSLLMLSAETHFPLKFPWSASWFLWELKLQATRWAVRKPGRVLLGPPCFSLRSWQVIDLG